MRFSSFAIVATAFTLAAKPALASKTDNQTQSAGNATALAGAIGQLPPCFLACAGQSAITAGCKGLATDLPCVCASPTFAGATSQCITTSTNETCAAVAKNTTALTEANQVFVSVCGAISNSSAAAAGDKATAGKNGSATAAPKAGTNAASSVQPALSHVAAAAAMVLSALAIGSATLL